MRIYSIARCSGLSQILIYKQLDIFLSYNVLHKAFFSYFRKKAFTMY